MSKCAVYWLTIEPDEIHKAKVNLLQEKDYEVFFFKTLDSLTKEIQNRRASIIIVGDEGPEVIVVKAIALLRRMPDIQGARLILSTSRNSKVVLRAAACEGFRDILPIHLPEEEWLRRFIFSTSGIAAKYGEEEQAFITPSHAALAIPARVVWMSPKQLWVESRIYPPVSSLVSLSGPIAQAMGHKYLNIQVEKLFESHLTYRFSQAIVGSWQIPDPGDPRVIETLHVLRNLDTGKRYRVFVAVQSPALRATLLRFLDYNRFDVHTALQKRSLIDEPKFFSPHLIFIEDRLCRGEGLDRFRAMLTNTPPHTTIVMIGNEKEVSNVKPIIGQRRFFTLKRIPVNFDQAIMQEYLPRDDADRSMIDANASFIPYDHEFSLAELSLPATLHSMDCHQAKLKLSIEVGNFGLSRLESPLLKRVVERYPYTKITQVDYSDEAGEDKPYTVECQFCDVAESQKEQLKEVLHRITATPGDIDQPEYLDRIFATLKSEAKPETEEPILIAPVSTPSPVLKKSAPLVADPPAPGSAAVEGKPTRPPRWQKVFLYSLVFTAILLVVFFLVIFLI